MLVSLKAGLAIRFTFRQDEMSARLILSGHARTVSRLHVEQADKQTPEVGSSDLVPIGRGCSSAKAEPMQLRFQCTIL